MAAEGDIVVPLSELHRLATSCIQASGGDEDHAAVLAEVLVTADYRGHYSHGLNRLDIYSRSIELGIACGGGKEPTVIRQTPATAAVNGHNLLGPVVGKFCIDLAIEKAKNAGIGIVTVKGSNHFGIAGWYSMRAADQGFLGFSFTNSSPVVIPTRAKERTLGSNPISFAAPGKDGDSMVLDMATASVAMGKLNIQKRKNLPIPRGWAVDKDGNETSDPHQVAGLLPLGGMEETCGYKGFGLGMMVEVLCSILAGTPVSAFTKMWKELEREANLAQCYIVIDPNAFEDGFEERLTSLMSHCRNLEPADGVKKVLIPGDPERQHMQLCDKLGGIPYHSNQIQHMKEFAEKMGVEPVKPL